MASLNDILRFKLYGDYLGQTCLNVFYYKITQLDSGLDESLMFTNFETQVVEKIATFQDEVYTHQLIEVDNLNDLDEFYQKGINISGDLTATSPGLSYVAYSFRLNRTTRQTRNGSKRFAGIPKEGYADNIATGSTAAAASSAAIFFGTSITWVDTGSTTTLSPTIVRYTELGGAATILATNPVGGCTFTGVTTQNSRKPE